MKLFPKLLPNYEPKMFAWADEQAAPKRVNILA